MRNLSRVGLHCITFLLSMALVGCIYHPPIQQGNSINETQVHSLHQGMTPEQVAHRLGSPVFSNIFANHQLIYVYTYKPGYRRTKEKTLIVYFTNKKMTRYSFTTSPHSKQLPEPTHSTQT